jgi:hypothetical protein
MVWAVQLSQPVKARIVGTTLGDALDEHGRLFASRLSALLPVPDVIRRMPFTEEDAKVSY